MNKNVFKKGVEYKIEDVLELLKLNNQFDVTLFYNVHGWGSYYTTESTGATPTGVLYKEGFPAKVKIEAHNQYTKPIIKPIKFIKG